MPVTSTTVANQALQLRLDNLLATYADLAEEVAGILVRLGVMNGRNVQPIGAMFATGFVAQATRVVRPPGERQ